MPYPLSIYGKATRVSETAATAITSANAAVIGVLWCGSGTGTVQLFSCIATASATTATSMTGVVRFMTSATGTAEMFREIPGWSPGGLVVNLGASVDPELVIFWNPTGEP